MKLQILFITLNLIISITCLSQNVNYFKEINVDITNQFESTSIAVDRINKELDYELTRSEGLLIFDLMESGVYYNNSLKNSGIVIINSEANNYLNKIKSKLLSDYPKFNQLIKVYITENSTLNAFATIDNSIFVNVGLLSRMDSEAEIAFILCHEIMHIINRHIITQHIEINNKIESIDSKNMSINDEYIQLSRHSLSRENEVEADIDGLKLFLKSGYSLQAPFSVLDKLKQADNLNVNSLNLKLLLAESDSASFSLAMKEYQTFLSENDKEEDIKYSTHPSLEIRYFLIHKYYTDLKLEEKNGLNYLISEVDFNEIKKQALDRMNYIFCSEKKYIPLFLSNIDESFNSTNHDNRIINNIGYAFQGMIFNKSEEILEEKYHGNQDVQRIFGYWSENIKEIDFSYWAYVTFKKIIKGKTSIEASNYLNSISSIIVTKFKDQDLQNKFGILYDDLISNVKLKDTTSKSLEMSFYINTYDASEKFIDQLKLNKVSDSSGFEGNVAIVDVQDYNIHNGILNYNKSLKLNRKSTEVFEFITEDYKGAVTNYIPNDIQYSTKDYEVFKLLNRWYDELQYFESINFTSFYKSEIDSCLIQEDIKYLMASLNIEIKSQNSRKESYSMMKLIPVPHFLPIILSQIFIQRTRKYQLTFIYDIQKKEIVFWSKSSYTNPNTTSQLYQVYNEVFSQFYKKKK